MKLRDDDPVWDNWPKNKRGYPKLFVTDRQADCFIRELGMEEDDFVRMKPLPYKNSCLGTIVTHKRN